MVFLYSEAADDSRLPVALVRVPKDCSTLPPLSPQSRVLRHVIRRKSPKCFSQIAELLGVKRQTKLTAGGTLMRRLFFKVPALCLYSEKERKLCRATTKLWADMLEGFVRTSFHSS